MKTPEELRESLEACFVKQSCASCHYGKDLEGHTCLINMCKDAKDRIEQLEEQVTLMKIQMHGDCGVCKHRSGCQIDGRDITMSKTCYDCMQKETRPNWEYEGLPEVKSK